MTSIGSVRHGREQTICFSRASVTPDKAASSRLTWGNIRKISDPPDRSNSPGRADFAARAGAVPDQHRRYLIQNCKAGGVYPPIPSSVAKANCSFSE
jgi:hypothetical protein